MNDRRRQGRQELAAQSQGLFSYELLDQLLAQVRGRDAESLLGESGLMGQLKKQLADVLIAVVDGLRGFPEAIEAIFLL